MECLFKELRDTVDRMPKQATERDAQYVYAIMNAAVCAHLEPDAEPKMRHMLQELNQFIAYRENETWCEHSGFAYPSCTDALIAH